MQALQERLQASWEAFGPQVVGAIIIMVVAYILALVVRAVLGAAIDRIPFVANANKKKAAEKSIGGSIGSAGFWIVILIGLVMALERLGMKSVSDSIRVTIDQIFAYLPQIIGAAITFFVFVIVARVARQAVTATLEVAHADELPKKIGLAAGPVAITSMLGAVVFALIIIPGGVAALEVLDIDAITVPAVGMLNSVMSAIPDIAVAAIIIGIFALIAKLVTDLGKKILPNTGIDGAVAKLGLLEEADSGITASTIVAQIAGLIILLLGLIQGMKTLGFEPLTEALDIVLSIGSNILFGSVIILAGVLVSGVVAKAMTATGGAASDLVAKIARYIIVALSMILGVSRMGLDPSGSFITDAALIILIGTALAGGIAFGLGGKDWAARQLDRWKS
jgi:Mechanosensitive ion channel, conserved TM helix